MKTKKLSKKEMTIDFYPVAQAMADSHNAGVTLAEKLRAIYDATGADQTVANFRQQFIQWAMSPAGGHAYSEGWAKEVLVDAEIRLRKPRSDSGNARTGAKAAASKVEKGIKYIKGLDLSKRDLAKFITALAEL